LEFEFAFKFEFEFEFELSWVQLSWDEFCLSARSPQLGHNCAIIIIVSIHLVCRPDLGRLKCRPHSAERLLPGHFRPVRR